jgi:hypothetical protein
MEIKQISNSSTSTAARVPSKQRLEASATAQASVSTTTTAAPLAHFRSFRKAPATMVSRTCDSTLSLASSTAQMPP